MGSEYVEAPPPARADVVVVGAGLAGLTAAARLAQRGVDVAVVEARGRVGGRTLSHPILGSVVDLGGQWVGPTQRRVLALAGELGVITYPQHTEGRAILAVNGKVRTYEGTIPSMAVAELVELLAAITRADVEALRVPAGRPWAAWGADALDRASVAEWLAWRVRGADARAVLAGVVRSVFAAEPSEVSLLFFLFYLRAAGGLLPLVEVRRGAQQDRLAGGAQQLAAGLAARLGGRVALGVPAVALRQAGGQVTVSTPRGDVRAGRAIVAVPPALLGRIAFDPGLPPRRAALAESMPMGAVVKCIVAYPEPFWRAVGLSGQVLSDGAPAQLVFDATPPDERFGALVAFMLGDAARAWGRKSRGERARAIVDQLAAWFGPRAARPLAYLDQDWAAEGWSRGCYVGIMPPGALTAAGDAIRAPVGLVHWAGTETATRWNGYMDGAIESGERAAGEVLP